MGKTRFVTRLASEALVAALTVGGALLFRGMADAAVPPTPWGILTIAPSSGIDLAVPVAHPSADCSPRVTDLHLSGGTLTKIVTRQTTNWSDPVIKADNPELAPPERTIVPVVRSDSADAKPGSQGVTELVAQDSSAGASLPINLVKADTIQVAHISGSTHQLSPTDLHTCNNPTFSPDGTVTKGIESMTTSRLTVGPHRLPAAFAPTDQVRSDLSTSNPVAFAVNAPIETKATTTTLTTFRNGIFEGNPVGFLAKVVPSDAAGSVQFMDGATALGTPVPVTRNIALLITALPKGLHSLTAVFIPADPAALDPSTSSPVWLTVDPLFSPGLR